MTHVFDKKVIIMCIFDSDQIIVFKIGMIGNCRHCLETRVGGKGLRLGSKVVGLGIIGNKCEIVNCRLRTGDWGLRIGLVSEDED